MHRNQTHTSLVTVTQAPYRSLYLSFLQRPNILILDEPTNHLDMESVDALIRAIKLCAGGVVLVSFTTELSLRAADC